MTLREIDRKTPEGRLLWAALLVLTTSPGLTIDGRAVNGCSMTPDDVMHELDEVATFNEKLDPPAEVLFSSAAGPGNVQPSTMSAGPWPLDEKQPAPECNISSAPIDEKYNCSE